MKVRISLKTPDAVQYAVEDAIPIPEGASYEETDELELQREELKVLLTGWFQYGESVTLEFDSDAKTCVVLPTKR